MTTASATLFCSVNAPADSVLLGMIGAASPRDIKAMASAVLDEGYRGIMVWWVSQQQRF